MGWLFMSRGGMAPFATPQAYLDRVKFETERWTRVVKENNIKSD